MRVVIFGIISLIIISSTANADERETIFEGLGTKIVSIVDDMTDKKSGAIFVDFGPIYMAVYGSNHYTIWSNSNDLYFAFDSTHLIRAGKNKPLPLHSLKKRNGLQPTNAKDAEQIIRALAMGKEVRLRYYDWPEHNAIDVKLTRPNFGFVYHKAAKIFGWKDFGESGALKPAKISAYIPDKPDSKGYADVSVIGNRDLSLKKNFDKYGGGAVIAVGVNETFGLHKGKWICKAVDTSRSDHLIIRDSDGNIIFKELLPSNYSSSITGEPWPIGKTAALKAWEAAPLGTIEVEGSFGKRASLYGYRELWKWGVQNAGFPSFKERK